MRGLDYDVLTAARPVIDGVGSLWFSGPESVRNQHGVLFTAAEKSSLGLSLNVEVGRVYLVDFVVRSFKQGSYVLTSNAKLHVYEDLGAAIRNVTVRLIAEESGSIHLNLQNQNGNGFYFHAVGVTSIEAAGPFAPIVEPSVGAELADQFEGLN